MQVLALSSFLASAIGIADPCIELKRTAPNSVLNTEGDGVVCDVENNFACFVRSSAATCEQSFLTCDNFRCPSTHQCALDPDGFPYCQYSDPCATTLCPQDHFCHNNNGQARCVGEGLTCSTILCPNGRVCKEAEGGGFPFCLAQAPACDNLNVRCGPGESCEDGGPGGSQCNCLEGWLRDNDGVCQIIKVEDTELCEWAGRDSTGTECPTGDDTSCTIQDNQGVCSASITCDAMVCPASHECVSDSELRGMSAPGFCQHADPCASATCPFECMNNNGEALCVSGQADCALIRCGPNMRCMQTPGGGAHCVAGPISCDTQVRCGEHESCQLDYDNFAVCACLPGCVRDSNGVCGPEEEEEPSSSGKKKKTSSRKSSSKSGKKSKKGKKGKMGRLTSLAEAGPATASVGVVAAAVALAMRRWVKQTADRREYEELTVGEAELTSLKISAETPLTE